MRVLYVSCTLSASAIVVIGCLDLFFRILVLDKGTVLEFDSPANLMDNPKTVFHDMAAKAGLLKGRPAKQ